MSDIFRIELLPAGDGDCIWIEYGDAEAPCRILIDGGRSNTWPKIEARLRQLPPGQREFELGVVTHVDGDHISGFIRMLEQKPEDVTFQDIWFNGRQHLTRPEDAELLAVGDGDRLTELIEAGPWNAAMDGAAVVVSDDGPLPSFTLAGGMRLTILSPNWPALEALRGIWPETLAAAGLGPAILMAGRIVEFAAVGPTPHPDTREEVENLAGKRFTGDSTPSNGSSIAFLAEYGGKRVLFTGDAHADILQSTLPRLPHADASGMIAADILKVPHHGSEHNVSTELVELVNCPIYLISANGSGTSNNPDPEAIARLLCSGPAEDKQLIFNYRVARNEIWNEPNLLAEFNYEAIYPLPADNGTIRIDLL